MNGLRKSIRLVQVALAVFVLAVSALGSDTAHGHGKEHEGEHGISIQGRVVDFAGNPQRSSEVTISYRDPALFAIARPFHRVNTDANGYFSTNWLPRNPSSGPWTIMIVSPQGKWTADLTIGLWSTEVRVEGDSLYVGQQCLSNCPMTLNHYYAFNPAYYYPEYNMNGYWNPDLLDLGTLTVHL